MIRVRSIELRDVAQAERVLAEAYGRPAGHFSIGQHVAAAPDDWIVADLDGELCGIVTAADYDGVAYIGMMAVDPKGQRRGVGNALMLRLVDKLKQCGTRTMLLDATEAGAKLYRRFGFVEADRVGVYRGRATQSPLPLPRFEGTVESGKLGAALAELAGLDRRVFGCDRRRLLERFAKEAEGPVAIARDRSEEICGYALWRKATLGPWLATSPAAAGALLGVLPLGAAPASAFVPQSNAAATALVSGLGLLLERSLGHMVWGAAFPFGGTGCTVKRLWGPAEAGRPKATAKSARAECRWRRPQCGCLRRACPISR